jgi:hypothetical protein
MPALNVLLFQDNTRPQCSVAEKRPPLMFFCCRKTPTLNVLLLQDNAHAHSAAYTRKIVQK